VHIVVAIIAALGLVTAAGREIREILSEATARHAKHVDAEVRSRGRRWQVDFAEPDETVGLPSGDADEGTAQ
jgi:hypothetical protein